MTKSKLVILISIKNKYFLAVFFLVFTYALNGFSQHTESEITFDDLLKASSKISNAKPHKRVDKAIAGSEISIRDKKYEIRFFSFEDPNNVLPSSITFREYVKNYNLGSKAVTHMKYMHGVEFEVFDYRFTKLEDGVYFSMALLEI